MRHKGTLRIETARLLLRPLTPDDAPAMYANWAGDPAVTRWLRWKPHRSAAFTRELLSAWAQLYANPDYYQWGIVEKSSGILIGTISLTDARFDPEARRDTAQWQAAGLDCADGLWEAGYCIGRRWWGRGFTTEALRAVLDFWFERVEADWLACAHAKENAASGAVMRKAGFRPLFEGVKHTFDGVPIDCVYMLLRKGEYCERII